MLVYLGLLAVLLIRSEVKNISEKSRTIHSDTYKDIENNNIDVNSYCESETCVVKCCSYSQVLNNEGVCYDEYNNEDFNHINNYIINVNKLNYTAGETKAINRKIYQDFAFVQNNKLSDAYTNGLQLTEFYILKNGFLQIKVNNTIEQWLGAAPFDFCVNNHLSAAISKQKQIRIIVKHAADSKKSADIKILKYVAGGMLVSLLLLGRIVYRMSPVLKRMLGLVLMAFISSLVVVYMLMAVQLFALRAGVINSIECRIISPFLYFFILSSFFWVNVMSYDTWWIIRNFRKYSTKINKEVDPAKFVRFAMYGWGIPFLMTIVAVVVDILKLDLLLPIEKPPFESCLVNDRQMMFYTHIPILILTVTNCLFFLMNIYNIWMLQRTYHNVIDITAILATKRRFIHFKLFAIIGVSAALELMPDVPIVLYYSINANNILVGGALCSLLIYEKCAQNNEMQYQRKN